MTVVQYKHIHSIHNCYQLYKNYSENTGTNNTAYMICINYYIRYLSRNLIQMAHNRTNIGMYELDPSVHVQGIIRL